LEIDGASNTGVDNIRELRSNVQFRPSRSRFKIYIIDEVHMLSVSAFNALLKTLEEPPPHVKFIFATTEVQKIPITVLSRCQRFDFGGISITRILERLKEIIAAEKMDAEEEALETIARRAGGSMRDAQSLLDQLLAFSGNKLTVATAHQLLGTAHEEHVTAIAGAVLGKDAKKVLEFLNEIANQGQQLGEVLDQLIEYWRDLMVVHSAGLEKQSVSVSSARRPVLAQHAEQATLESILAGMDILVTAKTRMRFSSHARAIMEMSLVRMCQLDELVPLAQMAQWLTKDGTAPQRPTSAAASVPSEKKKLSDGNGEPSQQLLADSGLAFQAELRKVQNTAISGPNSLVIQVSRGYNAPGSLFADALRLNKLAESLGCILGQPASIRVEWTDEPAQAVGTKSAAAVALGQQRQLRAELMQIPFVKKASDVLGAQIIRADEAFGAVVSESAAPQESTEEIEAPVAPDES
jgi:DNA polymerase-3 subunit gamma/tau